MCRWEQELILPTLGGRKEVDREEGRVHYSQEPLNSMHSDSDIECFCKS